MTDDLAERAALVALLNPGSGHPTASWPRLASEVLDRGSARDLLQHPSGQQTLINADADERLAAATALVRHWQDQGIGVHGVLDDTYPALLRDIRERPPIIFTKGQLADDVRAVAVVGSRDASPRGLRIANTIATEFARNAITVVSGLAEGIDTAAHTAALAAGARTVAVIGTGINRHYPASNRALQDQIADQGLVISQFWPDAAPTRSHFPMRNAVMSGYSAATVIVDAGEHSGTRIQARLAVQHGRHVIILKDLLHLQWARELAGRPGVSVVGSPDELFTTVEGVLAKRQRQLRPTPRDLADLVLT
ncbi:hypothetical protein Cs7R123_63970 [Catellatospora sp. TT07R-123]|uniref:DNA-processing protein DprA n=1 Tax=Catellatospora sp. TT07R-123 TaxID=2733863 RepID=UPI001B032106|nr:DNA-processing protein DprA [Catellatospora sp. TT07R-123]GHJ49055.1 hypothetical protein Cs7R123_63970 [Catellatospora sp. TT07R-123]